MKNYGLIILFILKMLPYIHVSYTPLCLNKKSVMNKKHQETLKNAYLSHRESMRRSLNARLEMAKANGNNKLVQQLEAEAKYLHL